MFAVVEYLVAFVAAFNHDTVMCLGRIEITSRLVELFAGSVNLKRNLSPLRCLFFGTVLRNAVRN